VGGHSFPVTGGAGFLGSHVVGKLRETDCADVFVVRSREYDLTHEDQVIRLFEEHPADIVIHLAGLVGGIGANKTRPADFFYQNLMMNTLTVHYAWKYGVEKVVAAAAGCGYPEHAPMPLKEESFWDGFPQQESAPYSLAKRMLHIQSIAYWRQHRFPAIVTIPGNIYGPYDNFDLENAHVIPALVRKFVEATDRPQTLRLPLRQGSGQAADPNRPSSIVRRPLLCGERAGRPVTLSMLAMWLRESCGQRRCTNGRSW
jgi:GDP-L-fucose synthase